MSETAPGHRPRWQHGQLETINVDADLYAAAVDGYATCTLWPALHGMERYIRTKDSWEQAAHTYNELVARSVARYAPPRSVVWIHDYQMFGVPLLLRALRPDVRIGFSLHTPFDAAMSWAVSSATVIAGVCGADRIGVQTDADRHILATVLGTLPCQSPTTVTSPVSVDPGLLDTLLTESATRTLINRQRTATAGRSLHVGIDRLDYTKGIIERLQAFDIAFARGWLAPDDVRIVQIAQPTRATVPEYQRLRLDVERLAYALAAKWPRADGSSPLEIRTESVDRREVAALLALADVCTVTPIRDGMNLVAKEFSVLNETAAGVLVLSEGAGAAADLRHGSLMTEGASPDAVATSLAQAMQVPHDVKRKWATGRAKVVRAWTGQDWANDFIEPLAAT